MYLYLFTAGTLAKEKLALLIKEGRRFSRLKTDAGILTTTGLNLRMTNQIVLQTVNYNFSLGYNSDVSRHKFNLCISSG